VSAVGSTRPTPEPLTEASEPPLAAQAGGGRGQASVLRTVIASVRRLPTKAKVGLAMLALFVLIAIIGSWIAPYAPGATTPGQALPHGPTIHHLLGTTATGQDVLSQLLVGTRSTVVLGLITGVIATLLSVAFGITSGYLGGHADDGLSLIANVFLVLPALPLLIVILGYLPHSGELSTAIVLSLLGWPWGARVIRAQTLSLRRRDYVAAAREVGESSWRIICCEILPNETGLIAASFVGIVLYAILTSVALAFIGVADLSHWSYGVMLYWAQNGNAVQLGAWWWYVCPGVCVALLGMSLVLINFGLDELSNPRLRSSRRDRRIGRRAWRPADPTPVLREPGEVGR
jgi:peptide/nickel transport system permease protein